MLVAMRVLVALALVCCLGCERPTICVPTPEDTTGEPRRKYDEFTQTTWLTSWFVFTPESVWGREPTEFEGRQWSMEMWLRASSKSPHIELTLRPICSYIPPEDGTPKCVNCDDFCAAERGYMEVLVDGQPINLPRASYKREQVGAPTENSPATWASTLSMQVDPRALWPMTQARELKLRVCQSFTVTVPSRELANLQEYFRHHQSFAPTGRPAGPGPTARPATPPP